MGKKKKNSKIDEGKLDADLNNEALTAEEISEKYTVPELKSILKENGLKVSGKKQDLVERVLPILNDDSGKTSGEDEDLVFPVNEELLSSSLATFGINYEELPIKDRISMGDNNNLNIEGFTQDGLSMSDFTMSIEAASDSSNIDLKMNIPEVSYTDFESTIFTFKNLDLSILPSSNPQSLEFSALMDSLEIITENNYVNLKGLNLLFKSSPDNGVCMDIGINSFIYPDFDDTSINFEDIDFNLAIGVDGQNLDLSVNLPKLTLLNKNYRVNLADLNLNIALPDLKLSSLDLSILMSDFHYTNFDDVVIDMDDVDVSLQPILDLNNIDVNIGMVCLDATGLNSIDELFPMLSITDVNIKNSSADSELPINLIGHMSLLDVIQMDLTTLGSLLSSGFDLDTYLGNMSDLYKSSVDGDVVDINGAEASDLDSSGFDLGRLFANFDYSSFDAIVLNLTGLLDSADIDLANFGIDVSDYDLSAIKLSDLIGALSNSDFVKSAIAAISKVFSIDFENLDFSGLIANFDVDNFDISSLLASLNLGDLDISRIIDLFTNSGANFASIFENFDYSCLDAITLDLTGLIDSLGIDLADLGIDLSGVDLSAIKLSEIRGILSNFDFDMSTITALLKLFGLDLEDIDLSGLIASFDVDNFDMSSLLASLNLDGLDISGIMELFSNLNIDFDSIFANCDYSSLDAMVLDLTGLLDSVGIDLAELGIDVSGVDLSAISVTELIGILSNLDFDISQLDLSSIDFNSLDMSGLVASFDADKFDLSSLLASLNLDGLDISGIIDAFTNSDIDLTGVFENCDYSCLDAIELNLTGLIDSLDIDLADLGIDLSGYDLSAIKLSDLIGIFSSLDIDMSTIAALLKLFNIDLDDLDLAGLISSFDADNFDLSSLLENINLGDLNVSAMVDMFNNLDVDFANIFENCDYSCLDAIVLDLTRLLDSADINLADFGIDVSDYDLSAIKLSDLIDAVIKSEFINTAIAAMSKLFSIDFDNIDWSGLIVSFDADKFDMSSLINSLDLSGFDTSGILDNFNMNGFDLNEFMNGFVGMFMEKTVPEATEA